MSGREAFGPNLRRTRLQCGVSLDRITAETNVPVELWEGMERNDFSRWPSGIFARAYVRAYAAAVGVDPETTVEEFCRWFPQGDRRAHPLMQAHAEVIGHNLEWHDDVPAPIEGGDRRAGADPVKAPPAPEVGRLTVAVQVFGRLRRAFGRA
jgi:hypothetical protein